MKIVLTVDFSKPDEHDQSVLSVIDGETKEILLYMKLDKLPEQSEQDEIKRMIKNSVYNHISGIKRRVSSSPLEQWMVKHGS